jgi:hypothetical protein
MRWAELSERIKVKITEYGVLFGNPEGKRLLGRRSGRWEDNIIYLEETGWEGVNWIDLVQDRNKY